MCTGVGRGHCLQGCAILLEKNKEEAGRLCKLDPTAPACGVQSAAH